MGHHDRANRCNEIDEQVVRKQYAKIDCSVDTSREMTIFTFRLALHRMEKILFT